MKMTRGDRAMLAAEILRHQHETWRRMGDPEQEPWSCEPTIGRQYVVIPV